MVEQPNFVLSPIGLSFKDATEYCKKLNAKMLYFQEPNDHLYWESVFSFYNVTEISNIYWLSARRMDSKWKWIISSKKSTSK